MGLTEQQWTDACFAYRHEIKPNGKPISTIDLAKRYRTHNTIIGTGLKTRGVEMRSAANVKSVNAPPQSKPRTSILTGEIRQEARVLALVGLLDRKGGRVYLHEIQAAFECSPFESAEIASAVKDRTGAAFDFEPHNDACGLRIFLEKATKTAPTSTVVPAPFVQPTPSPIRTGQHGVASINQASVSGG